MYDLSQVETTSNLIPDGIYTVQVEEAKEVPTKDKQGKLFKVTLNIIGPSQNGRKLFPMFNTVNNNPLAVKIGLEQLKLFAIAAGLDTNKSVSSEMFLNKVLDVKVGNKTDDQGEKNVIKKYMPSSSNAVPSSDAINF